ncbi:hypothetical protein [Bacterioplanoides sp.]|uniref:hypothetical protein n=1 Tax=Bacterioplanoides sp. TaxID=2066072 RepID=UPI003B00BDA7
MNIEDMVMLPKIITDSENLENEFKELFGSDEAKKAKKVVYFFRSLHPVARFKGESDILYIGKTEQSMKTRYFRYAKHLSNKANGSFYKYVIENYGGLRVGYIFSDDPKSLEREAFDSYRATYMENPPKSKVG